MLLLVANRWCRKQRSLVPQTENLHALRAATETRVNLEGEGPFGSPGEYFQPEGAAAAQLGRWGRKADKLGLI